MSQPVIRCDVLVAGTGGGALMAAITARHLGLEVLVVEKMPAFGGTTARAGGWIWVPGNPIARRQGVHEDLDAVRTYIRHGAGNFYDSERVAAYLSEGPRMVDFLEKHTEVRFDPASIEAADYRPEDPGGAARGRSIQPLPYDGHLLGRKLLGELAPPRRWGTLFGAQIPTGAAMKHFQNACRSPRSALFVAGFLARQVADVIRFGRSVRLQNGNALTAALRKTLADQDVPVWLSSPLRKLIRVDGRVVGAIVLHEGKEVEITARRGVVLGTGGFSHAPDLKQRLMPHVMKGASHGTPTASGATGDGLRAAEGIGAGILEARNAAAWTPVTHDPRYPGDVGTVPVFSRAQPGSMVVRRNGRRFAEETLSYHDFGEALVKEGMKDGDFEAFLIADARSARVYGLGHGAVRPRPFPIGPHVRSGFVLKAATIEALAEQAGIDPGGLAAEIARFNRFAFNGKDEDFGRGSNVYARQLGDPTVMPNPCLAPISEPPFYALRLYPGDIGTMSGLRVDAHAQVLDQGGLPIPGLYAVGSDASNVFGGSYPGRGAMIGPGMVFGYIAGQHLGSPACSGNSGVAAKEGLDNKVQLRALQEMVQANLEETKA